VLFNGASPAPRPVLWGGPRAGAGRRRLCS
jgi:hypothetical protein